MQEKLKDKSGRRTIENLTGGKYGRLSVLGLSDEQNNKSAMWRCQCECGNVCNVASYCLKKGNTRSCGCLGKEVSRKLGKALGGHNVKPDSAMRCVFRIYKRGADERGFSFDLTLEEFKSITQKNCVYCGSPPSAIFKKCEGQLPFVYNGIDREDNEVGYLKTNCVPCCKSCNIAKHQMKDIDFAKWVCQVADNWAKSFLERKHD